MNKFEWDDEKEKCLDLILKGVAKTQIADELGVHRNSIRNWCSNPVFRAKVLERMNDHRDRVQHRRTTEVGLFADIAGKVAMDAAKKLSVDPNDHQARKTFQEFTREWRENVREEREVLGTNVQRIETHFAGEVTHQVGTSFRDALKERLRSDKVIDVSVIETAKSPMEAVQSLVRGLLVADSSVIDQIQAGEVEAEQKAEKKRK